MTLPQFWREKRVLVTGHMGFKGAWLTSVLARFGARTVGYGWDDREPLLYRDLEIDNHSSVEADILDTERLAAALIENEIDSVFHLAAQPSVRDSYRKPLETFASNILGTASLLQAVRSSTAVEVVICVTSDKVYENREWDWAYRETDPLGGHDPYSASKAAAELVVSSMARAFFGRAGHRARVATVRAGNVIGGGDWCEDRIIPDAARAFSKGDTLKVRNPHATRPWQHVLDPLCGYLELAQFLWAKDEAPFPAWNFGPDPSSAATVADIVGKFAKAWGRDCGWHVETGGSQAPHEAGRLSVDSTRSRCELGWHPVWDLDQAITRSAEWYRSYCEDPTRATMLVGHDIDAFFDQKEIMDASKEAAHSSTDAKQRTAGNLKDRIDDSND